MQANTESFEGFLLRKDGRQLMCVVSLTPIQVAGHRGLILLAKDIARQTASSSESGLGLAAHQAPVGIFRCLPARRGIFLDINPTGRVLLAHLADNDQTQLALADLFSDPDEFSQIFKTLLQDGEIKDHLLHIETQDAAARFFSLSARLVRGENDQPLYIAGILDDRTAARRRDAGREALIEKLQTSLLFLHEPLTSIRREALICSMDTTIAQLARLMTEREATAALVASEASVIIGIITDHDLRERVLAEGVQLNAPIYTIMSAPVTRISENALIYEALMQMEEKGVRHLAVEDQNGQINGVIDSKSLIQFQRYGPIVLAREIVQANDASEIVHSTQRITPLVKSLLDSSARPRHVTSMLASTCDAVTERLIELAMDELGPPPAPFVFIAMGSQGRQEQTLLTDQDNGIIYHTIEPTVPEIAANYFLSLGKRVCSGLNQAGYTFCQGKVMANNPRWCRSLSEWTAEFDRWAHMPESQEILDFSIFFDFRTVYGEADLAHTLRQHIHNEIANAPAFFYQFTQSVLSFKPPFRLLGNIYLGAGSTERSGEINLKDAMMPVVSFARLYALRHQVNQTNTIDRMQALADKNVISTSSRDEIITAYDFLMQLRLQTQLAAIQAGRLPENTIHPGKLGYIQKELLKQAFAQIAAVQKKASFDFLGGT